MLVDHAAHLLQPFLQMPVNIGQTITFDASLSPNGNGQISEYRWDVFDDGTIDATGMKYDFSLTSSNILLLFLILQLLFFDPLFSPQFLRQHAHE